MNPDPKSNYLCHTAPEAKQRFVDLLTQLELFHHLPESLCDRIFDYAKFIELKSGDRPVVEGMFDQEIFLLINGRLDVFIKVGSTDEKQIDSLTQPFTLFGERCLLGQPRGASIQANGRVLLLGLDLSSLPDITEHLEMPELRLPDPEYQNNFDLYMVVASVLYSRLVRLEHDQYKLDHKIREIQKQSKIHRKMSLKTSLYNELITNNLSDELRGSSIWSRMIRSLKVESLSDLLKEPLVDTQKIYNGLVKAQSLGELIEEDWMHLLLKRLSEQARFVTAYQKVPVSTRHLPKLLQMSTCLVSLFEELSTTGLLSEEETLKAFLGAQDQHQAWNPSIWADKTKISTSTSPWFVKSQLGLSLSSLLIEWVSKANQAIASYVDYLSEIHSKPKQNVPSVGARMVDEFERYYADVSSGKTEPAQSTPVADVPGNVDDLLAQFGM